MDGTTIAMAAGAEPTAKGDTQRPAAGHRTGMSPQAVRRAARKPFPQNSGTDPQGRWTTLRGFLGGAIAGKGDDYPLRPEKAASQAYFYTISKVAARRAWVHGVRKAPREPVEPSLRWTAPQPGIGPVGPDVPVPGSWGDRRIVSSRGFRGNGLGPACRVASPHQSRGTHGC